MIKERFEKKIKSLQKEIVTALQNEDPTVELKIDKWARDGGGGGISNVLSKGKYIEKGGVNISIVHGDLPEEMQNRLDAISAEFYASGISLVIHPFNPFAPTVHFNIRYFELYKEREKVDAWFGGGMDLTPYYAYDEDAVHFHKTLQSACNQHDLNYYPDFKKRCDDYFYNAHRNEHRGIGGIFYDYLKASEEKSIEELLAFSSDIGDAFILAYIPILSKRKATGYKLKNKEWQEIRRGRYVEFNLVHDRGTLFGLKTKGRIESILMSLPPTVRWVYDHHPEEGSREAQLLEAIKPKDWLSLKA